MPRFAPLGLLLALLAVPVPAKATEPVVAGWIERISLPEHALVFEAKLDTGADTSSLNGQDIERFRRAGRPFVRFTLTDDAGTSKRIEAPVNRVVRIRRAGSSSDRRVVIRLRTCVGGIVADSDFTLADRNRLDYQALIGRNLLRGRFLVDSSRERIISDRCPR
jgi:hypothetical protein